MTGTEEQDGSLWFPKESQIFSRPSQRLRAIMIRGGVTRYWVSYDKSFPKKELKRLCDEPPPRPDEEIRRLKARDIFSLYYAYD